MIQIAGSQLNQWDVGRSVSVSDSQATHVHFANQGDSKAVIIEITDGTAKIPNYLLQTGKPLLAYAVLDGVTLECKSFAVHKRERPENYVYEDDRRNYIYELITRAEDAVENANQAAQKANEAAETLGSIVIPTKVSQLENDIGFLTKAPVTSVNGQTGDVTLPTPVKVSVTQQPDGSYTADLRTAQIVAAYQAGSAVYCCFGQLVLALSYASLARCIFTCIYNGRLHIISVESSGTTVSDTALGSGDGSDGITPHIGDNGNWFIGDTDTGVRAAGKDGKDAPQEAVLYTPQTLTPEQQAQVKKNIGLEWKFLDTFDLSSGALSYTTDTAGCKEVLTIVTEALTASGCQLRWKSSPDKAHQYKFFAAFCHMTYLGDGFIFEKGNRQDNSDLVIAGILASANEENNDLTLTCASASAGILRVYGR